MSSNKNVWPNLIFMLCLVLAAGAVVFFVVQNTTSAAPQTAQETVVDDNEQNPETTVELPVKSLEGNWSTETSDPQVDAVISAGQIEMRFVKNDTSMLYWVGTFKTAESPNATIVSDKVDINKAVLSGADSKTFTVKDDTITFELEVMGVKRNLVLTRA
jgi:cytoskeletal protein RodZ